MWTNPDPAVVAARPAVRPGAAFVDAGGVEECFPTVRGRPDHGDAWSRRWTGSPADAAVELPGGFRLARRIVTEDGAVVVDHTVSGRPGARVVHAVHALLDLSPSARLEVPGGRSMVVLDDDDGHAPPVAVRSGRARAGRRHRRLRDPPRLRGATVVDGDHALTFAWSSPDRPDLCSLMLWRNLGGWPDDGPYRSIGVEPMLGRTADPALDDTGSCRLEADTPVRWSLRVTAGVR